MPAAQERGSLSEYNSIETLTKPSLICLLHSLTQATDTSNIRLVFAAVKDTILHNALADSGIL